MTAIPISSPRVIPSESILDGLAIAVLVAVGGIAAFTFRDYGLGWDDFTHAEYGDLLLALYGSGFSDTRALHFVNLYEYGGGFDMAAALAAKVLPFGLFETRRLLGAVVGLIGLSITWRIARRIGGPAAGLTALVLLAICPLYYGQMFMNPKDAPFAVALALLLLAFVRAFDTYPRPTPATVVLFGLGLGLTIGSRIIGGMSGLYAAAAVVVLVTLESRSLGLRAAAVRLRTFVVRLLPGLALGYVVMGIVWPWSIASPLNPLRATLYFSHFFEKPWRELFDGVLIPVVDMPRRYVPTLFALTMPEIVIALMLAGLALALVDVTRREIGAPRRASLVLLAVAGIFPIVFTIAMRPAMYNGIRHFVFVTPPLAVLGGYAGASMLAWLSAHGRAAVAAGAIGFAALVALPVTGFARLHPYEYTFFNQLAGGVRGAEPRYMLDYWGLSFKQAGGALLARLAATGEKPPAGRKWKIAVCGPHPPAAVALGPDFDLTWDPKGADLALMLGVFYCAAFDAPVLAEIRREGVLYARVYDIRGRSFSSLFRFVPAQ